MVVYRFDCGIKSAGFPKVTSVWELTAECSVCKMKCKFQRFSSFLQARTRNKKNCYNICWCHSICVLACWTSSEILYYSVHAVLLYLYLHFVVLYQYNMQHLKQSSTRKYQFSNLLFLLHLQFMIQYFTFGLEFEFSISVWSSILDHFWPSILD